MSDFYFNDKWASEMGLVVERRPRQHMPRRRITSHVIPGMDGVLHESDGTFEPYIQVYECWFKSNPVAGQAHAIKEWLSSAPVGTRLEESNDPTVYHYATYHGGGDIENIHDRFGRFTVEFECDPRAYLKIGDAALNITSSGLLNNPTDRVAFPLIEVTGSVSGQIIIGSNALLVRIPDFRTATLRIDTFLQEAWDITDGNETSMNTWVTKYYGNSFPVLAPGTNKVEITGNLDSLRIYPRWWTL